MFIEQTHGQRARIKFDINEKPLLLGDILKITASGKDGVLAQVLEIYSPEKTPNFNVADCKIIFTIEQSGRLTAWQGNVPSQEFCISRLTAEETLVCSNTLNPQNAIEIGSLSLYHNTEVNLEASLFDHPTVVYCDKQSQKNNILNLLSCELSKNNRKTVLIDFNGDYSDIKVSSIIFAGKDFKIPLNNKGFDYLQEKVLCDLSIDTRAAIEEIFMELENYLSSDDIDFIAFSSLLQAIESVDTENLPALILLKNKLIKLHKNGIFADSINNFSHLNNNMTNNNLVIVNLSGIPDEWKKRFIEFIVDSSIETYKQKFHLLLDISKIDADKSFVEKLCGRANKNGLHPLIIAGHESEYSVSLLSYTKNLIAFAPENTTSVNSLNEYIVRIKDNEALLNGKITNNVPLYVDIFDMDAFEEACLIDKSAVTIWDEPEIYLSRSVEESPHYMNPDPAVDDSNFNYSGQFAHDESEIDLVGDISNLQEEIYPAQNNGLFEEETNKKSFKDEYERYNTNAPTDSEINPQIIYQDDYEDNQEADFEVKFEEDEEDNFDDEIETEEENENESSVYSALPPQEPLDSQIPAEYEYAEPQDESYEEAYGQSYSEDDEQDLNYNIAQTNDDEEMDLSNFVSSHEQFTSPAYAAQSEHSQSDEDFDYNSNQEFEDESILDYYSDSQEEKEPDNYETGLNEEDLYPAPIQENYAEEPQENESYGYALSEDNYELKSSRTAVASPPIADIPVYPTPSTQSVITGDTPTYQEGDRVQHPKYGIGTIVKIIGYETKKLCSIQFDEAGRRLLDPNLSGLVKI